MVDKIQLFMYNKNSQNVLCKVGVNCLIEQDSAVILKMIMEV